MLHTISSGRLTVTVSELGAELQSLRSGETEYLWQGDPAYWNDRALNIFPYVARLTQGQYVMDGETHSMSIHGFAPTSRFSLTEKTETGMTFELCDGEETFEQYPRRFAFRVIYALDESALKIAYEVENRDEKTMYFGLGGHPGFNVPLEEGKAFEDYVLRFAAPCEPVRVGFSQDCFVNGEDAPLKLEKARDLPLRHDLFDNDAIVLKNMAREVTLFAPGGSRSVTVSFPDMPILGIWHWPKTDAPYVCIEPWSSLPSRKGRIEVFEEQEDLIRLKSGGTYRNEWSIRIGSMQI